MELKGSKTEKNLMEAFAGESQARNKYTYFASKAKKEGHIPNMITNFSAPFDKIESFLNIVKNDLNGFSISIHVSQWENINELYEKLERLVNYKKINNYEWNIFLTCVITEENFDKAIEIGNYIKEKFGLNIKNVPFSDILNLLEKFIGSITAQFDELFDNDIFEYS